MKKLSKRNDKIINLCYAERRRRKKNIFLLETKTDLQTTCMMKYAAVKLF
jgi:hypothetical protein